MAEWTESLLQLMIREGPKREAGDAWWEASPCRDARRCLAALVGRLSRTEAWGPRLAALLVGQVRLLRAPQGPLTMEESLLLGHCILGDAMEAILVSVFGPLATHERVPKS